MGLVLAAIAYFLKDANGVAYRLVGSYVWIIAFTFTLVIGLFYFAQFILPLRWQDSWFEGLRLTAVYNFPIFSSLVLGQSAPSGGQSSHKDDSADLSPAFSRHGAGVQQSHTALALTRGSIYTRAAGPGYVRLNKGEMVAQILDLRRHVRREKVKAMTRDGIPVETTVTIVFQVKHQATPEESDFPYPYETGEVFKVNYLANISTGEGQPSWTERVCQEAASLLVAELSRHTLDDLFLPDRTRAAPMEKIERDLGRQIGESFDEHGIEIFAVEIGQLQLPDSVTEQRLEVWRSKWRNRIESEQTAGEVEAMRRIRLARARAQIDMIQKITESIEAMRRTGNAELTEIVALRTIEAMEEAATDDAVQALVPIQAMTTLRQLQVWLQD